jgi:hypothetical protein
LLLLALPEVATKDDIAGDMCTTVDGSVVELGELIGRNSGHPGKFVQIQDMRDEQRARIKRS